ACELVAVSLQTLAQLQVVLDDAVVDQRDVAVAVGVGMCVVIGWASVGRPSGVADPRFPLQLMSGKLFLERLELPRFADDVDARAVEHGDARRVVSSIFDPSQAVDNDGERGLVADDADDAAHIEVSVSAKSVVVPWPNGRDPSPIRR